MDTIQAYQGVTVSYQIQLRDSSGNPYLGFTGTETLTAVVWSGDDLVAITGVSAPAWAPSNGGPLGLVNVTISGSATASLVPGTYRHRLLVNSQDVYEGEINLDWSPGTSTPLPVYCTMRDLRGVCSWIEQLYDPDIDQAGFVGQCVEAREWFDECCLRNYAGGWVDLYGAHGQALASWFGAGPRKTLTANLWLKQQLADNHLIVSPRVLKVNALYAVGLIFQRNLTRSKDYLAMAALYRHQANQLLIGTTAEIDPSGTGTTPSVPISFSEANVRFA